MQDHAPLVSRATPLRPPPAPTLSTADTGGKDPPGTAPPPLPAPVRSRALQCDESKQEGKGAEPPQSSGPALRTSSSVGAEKASSAAAPFPAVPAPAPESCRLCPAASSFPPSDAASTEGTTSAKSGFESACTTMCISMQSVSTSPFFFRSERAQSKRRSSQESRHRVQVGFRAVCGEGAGSSCAWVGSGVKYTPRAHLLKGVGAPRVPRRLPHGGAHPPQALRPGVREPRPRGVQACTQLVACGGCGEGKWATPR